MGVLHGRKFFWFLTWVVLVPVVPYIDHVPSGCMITRSISETMQNGIFVFDAFFFGSSLKIQVRNGITEVVFFVNNESTVYFAANSWHYQLWNQETQNHTQYLAGWTNLTITLEDDLRVEAGLVNELIGIYTPSGHALDPTLDTSVLIMGTPLTQECNSGGPTLDISRQSELELLVGLPGWQHRFTIHASEYFCFRLHIWQQEARICGGAGDVNFSLIFNLGIHQDHQLVLPLERKTFTLERHFTDVHDNITISFTEVTQSLLLTYNLPWKTQSLPDLSSGTSTDAPELVTTEIRDQEEGVSIIMVLNSLLIFLAILAICIPLVPKIWQCLKRKIVTSKDTKAVTNGQECPKTPTPVKNPELLLGRPPVDKLKLPQRDIPGNFVWDEENIYENDEELLYIIAKNMLNGGAPRELSNASVDHIYEEIPECNVALGYRPKHPVNTIQGSPEDISGYVDMSRERFRVIIHQADVEQESPQEGVRDSRLHSADPQPELDPRYANAEPHFTCQTEGGIGSTCLTPEENLIYADDENDSTRPVPEEDSIYADVESDMNLTLEGGPNSSVVPVEKCIYDNVQRSNQSFEARPKYATTLPEVDSVYDDIENASDLRTGDFRSSTNPLPEEDSAYDDLEHESDLRTGDFRSSTNPLQEEHSLYDDIEHESDLRTGDSRSSTNPLQEEHSLYDDIEHESDLRTGDFRSSTNPPPEEDSL